MFLFILKKAVKPAVILTAGFLCAALVFLSISYHNSFGKAKGYDRILSGFSNAEEGYKTSKAQSTVVSDSSKEIYSKAEKYIASHKRGNVPAPLPDSMVDEIIEARAEDSDYNSIYSLISTQLYPQAVSYKLITERVEGYNRNIRRGVKDEFSLKTAEQMTEDYSEVLQNEESSDTVYDTRAVDVFTNFMSTEMISYIGVFMLTFSAFSSELQSRRFASIKTTAFGAKKYTAVRTLTVLLQTVFFFTVYYFALSAAAVISSESTIMSMPVQYLKGYELAHLPMNFGRFIAYVYVLKLLHLLALASVSMLMSFICGKVIVSAFGSGLVFALSIAAGRIDGTVGQILSCDLSQMNRDISVIDLKGTPAQTSTVFCVVMIFFAATSFLITVLLSNRRRVYA